MRRVLLAAAVLVAVTLSGCLQGSLVGEPAPSFRLTTTDGEVINESSYEGQWLILDLMATWCGPCILEVQHLREVQRLHGDKVAIVSIGVDPQETPEDLDRFAEEHGATWPRALDASGAVGRAYNLGTIPKLVILDPQGVVVFEQDGEVGVAAISRLIDPDGTPPAGEPPMLMVLLGASLGFLAWFNPYRRFHRDSARRLVDAAALAAFALLAFLGWRFAALVSTRATLSSLLLGILTVGAAAWWRQARRKAHTPPEPKPLLEAGDRIYEATPHFALALVVALSAPGHFAFALPLVGFLVGAAAGVLARARVPERQREGIGLVGLVLAGLGLLVFGSRFLFAQF